MNWLAHVYLSEPSGEFRLGNLLPDMARVRPLPKFSPEIMRGVECHYRIDAFTDRDAVVRRSIERIQAPYRRFGGILVDMFYDHFLASAWNEFSPVALTDFAQEGYGSMEPFYGAAPEETVAALRRMRAEDWLASYATEGGIEVALGRLSRRLHGRVNLAPAVGELERHYEGLKGDFREFFPRLQAHVALG